MLLKLHLCNEWNKAGYMGRFYIGEDFRGSLEGIFSQRDWERWKKENPKCLILRSRS